MSNTSHKEYLEREGGDFEREYDTYLLVEQLLTRIQWESQYLSYVLDQDAQENGYQPSATKHQWKELYEWHLKEEIRLRREFKEKQQEIRMKIAIREKIHTLINVIMARIDAGLPPPQDLP